MEDDQYQDSVGSDRSQSISDASGNSEYLRNIAARERKHMEAISPIVCRRDSKGFGARTLTKAVENGSLELVHLLLRYCTHPIDEELVLSSIRYSSVIMTKSLLHWSEGLVVNDKMLIEAVGHDMTRGYYGLDPMLELLLQHEGDVTVTNEDVIRAAVLHDRLDWQGIRLLLQHWAGPPISDETFMDAIENDWEDARVTRIFLGYREQPITEAIIQRSLRSRSPPDILQAFVAHGLKAPLSQEFVDKFYLENAQDLDLLKVFTWLTRSIAWHLQLPRLKELTIADPDTSSNNSIGHNCPCQTPQDDQILDKDSPPTADVSWGQICLCARAECKFCVVIMNGLSQLLDLDEHDFCECQKASFYLIPGEPLTVRLRPPTLWDRLPVEVNCSKRCEERDGCCVSLQFYMSTGDRVFSQYIGPARTTSTNRATEECFTLANQWLEYCIANHTTCAPPSDRLPKRVINVGSDLEEPRLYKTGNERAWFVALSHCWGSAQVLTTTTSTVAEREKRIMMSSLPKTFRDAVIVTWQLGVEYLWIDSLCILQDSAEDWAEESAEMHSIYSGAAVVIAADAAPNSTEGCFGPFAEGPGPMISVAIPCIDDDGLDCQVYARKLPRKLRRSGVDHVPDVNEDCYNLIAPLARRAWTLQERVLATRVLHYGYSEVSWGCYECTRCECSIMPEREASTRQQMLGKLALASDQPADTSTQIYQKDWYGLVETYTALALTFASDRLAALSGLATKYQSSSGEYIGGIWRDDFVRGLLWHSHNPHAEAWGPYWEGQTHARHQQYLAPSWSWASICGVVKYNMHDTDPEIFDIDAAAVEVLDVEYTLASSNAYGALSSGSVTMRGSPLPILLEPNLSIRLDMRKYSTDDDVQESHVPLYGTIELDVDEGEMSLPEVLVQKPLLLLILMTHRAKFASVGIILRETGDAPEIPTFERVGLWKGHNSLEKDGVVAEIAMETLESQIFKVV